MFTGIIEEIGKVKQVKRGEASSVLTIEADTVLEGTAIGDSISVNGVCLTVTQLLAGGFEADVMAETLDRSNIGELETGHEANLERAMNLQKRLGGHIVSGHIDGTGVIKKYKEDDNAVWVTVATDSNLLRYIIEKGSIAIDGISLTVAAVDEHSFAVAIIPHTAEQTTLLKKKVGDTVNLECDMIGKYVEKLLGLVPQSVKKDAQKA
ncbi:riboflavin synthase [Atopococcus tabaci]|uniref:riboflavin synthase n=1 Tax=Atopococcus tabaci TaxID=269774 RepID=UPI0003FBF2B0|nr:riboflavin synthase [Atopococcus tabaci]